MIEELYGELELVDATQPTWQRQVLRLLDTPVPREAYTITPLGAILNLAEGLGTKTVVLELDYVDSDFGDEFRTCYSRQFRGFPSKCTRIHFFNTSFTKDNLPDLDLAGQGYLGFSVVRPILSFCTGRTILRSPRNDTNSMYTLCKADFEAHLVGNRLRVSGMPFIQQDTNVGVCAQAALWMSSLYMHERFHFARFTPSEITTAATRSLTIGPVRSGLMPEQVLAALREMGFTPFIFTHYDPTVTARIIYAYVESELPIILLVREGTEGHAVVVIGHDFHRRRKPKPSWDSNIHWIDRFYIHDDARGPYFDLLLKRRRGVLDLLLKQRRRVREHAVYSVEEHASYVIVPVPPIITMQADDVFRHVSILIDHLNEVIDFLGRDAEVFRFSDKELAGLIFRTYLRPSNDFKTSLSPGMSKFFQHCYRGMRMPRYIWITEITKAQHINKTLSRDRKIIGEVIIDSTADRHAHMNSYLAIHLLGRMIIRHPKEHILSSLYVDPTEQPYGHLVR